MTKRRRRLVPLLFLLAATAHAEPQPPGSSAPVPIYRPEIAPPLEAAGTGLAPTAGVRVKVDARGKVASVEVRDIEPSSALDDSFRKAIVDTVSTWRFAPAVEKGQPVEATLEWRVRFHWDPDVGPRGRLGESWRISFDDADWDALESWSSHLASLSLDQRREALQEARDQAERFLAGTRSVATTDRFVVVSDADDARFVRGVAQNLEACYATVFHILEPRIEPRAPDLKVFAYAYGKSSSFRQLANRQLAIDGADGFFDPVGILSFHRELSSDETLIHVMLHEAVHSFLDNHVVRRGVQLPIWFHEGFAEYVASSAIKDGKIVPGEFRQAQLYHAAGVLMGRGKSYSALGAVEVKKAIRGKTAIPLGELAAARRADFYGDKIRFFYTESWMFVHFLRHGRPSWAEGEFPTLVLFLAEGYPPDESFRAAYGCEPESLAPEFERYVLKF